MRIPLGLVRLPSRCVSLLHLSAMGRDCSIELAVPASSSLCALSVAPAVAAVDASARAAVSHLQRYMLEHHSFLPCPATMYMSCLRRTRSGLHWTLVSHRVIHSFSLLPPLPSLPPVPRPLLQSVPSAPARVGPVAGVPLPSCVLSHRWTAAFSPATRQTAVREGLTGQGRGRSGEGGEEKM